MDHPEAAAEGLDEAAEELAVSVEAVARISAEAAAAVDPRLLPHRLRVLTVVLGRPGVNLTGLAAAVGLTLPRASRVCSGMESAGLLERRPVAGNRREIELVLMPAGEALLRDFRARRNRKIAEAMGRMPVDERLALLSGLRSFSRSRTVVGDDRLL